MPTDCPDMLIKFLSDIKNARAPFDVRMMMLGGDISKRMHLSITFSLSDGVFTIAMCDYKDRLTRRKAVEMLEGLLICMDQPIKKIEWDIGDVPSNRKIVRRLKVWKEDIEGTLLFEVEG